MQRCSKKAFAMCPNRKFCGTAEDAEFADDSECAEFNRAVENKPMTNADRIRAMSDEELVVFLDGFSGRCLDCAEDAENKSCPIYKNGHYCRPQDIMKWLQQPAGED